VNHRCGASLHRSGGRGSRPEILEMMRDCVGFRVLKTRTPEENKIIKGEERTRRLELLERKQKKVGKVVKKLTKMESEEMKVQTRLQKEIVEIQKNLESYQKEGKRTKLSSAPKGWKVSMLQLH
jgi:hypothetical protein